MTLHRKWVGILLTLAGQAALAAVAPTADGRSIARIHIVRRAIFDTSLPSENKLFYRAVNRLHILTQEHTVREQLLFKPGDPYNSHLALETERALRKVLRLRDVHVRPAIRFDGAVDVWVETQDTWTTEPFIGVSGSGDDSKYVVGVRERNLLGHGKFAGFLYKKEPDLVSRIFSYDDPAVWGRRLKLSGDYIDTAEGSSRALSLERPFYSSVSRFSFRTQGHYDNGDTLLYQNGEEVARYHRENRDLGGGVGFSLGSTARRIRRAGLQYRFSHQRLSDPATRALLRDDVIHLVGPTVDWQRVDFRTETHIRQYSRDEDFNLAPTVSAWAALSQSQWTRGAANAFYLQTHVTQGHAWAPGHFALGTLRLETNRKKSWEECRARMDLEYYRRWRSWSTWAAHAAWEHIERPEVDTQLKLGGSSGLRGYPINQFTGRKSGLVNIENRVFFVDDIFQFLGMGAVAFADAGYTWPRNHTARWSDWRAAYGLGLRVHLSRASLGQVLRFDLAWPTRSTEGDRSPVFTFGTGQVF